LVTTEQENGSQVDRGAHAAATTLGILVSVILMDLMMFMNMSHHRHELISLFLLPTMMIMIDSRVDGFH
jgi:di/tricarboxylate transporter